MLLFKFTEEKNMYTKCSYTYSRWEIYSLYISLQLNDAVIKQTN